MSTQGWVCTHCNRDLAVSFCLCSSPVSVFCSACIPTHHSKYPSTHLHNLLPMSVYGLHTTPGFVDRFQQRQVRLVRRKGELLKGVETVAEGLHLFVQTMEKYLVTVIEYTSRMKNQITDEARRLEAEILAGIAEAEQLVCFERPKVSNRWADFILNADDRLETPAVFRYSIDTSRNFDLETIIRYTCAYTFDVPNQFKIPAISKNQLRLYDIPNSTETALRLNQSFPRGINYCWIDDQFLLCVGGSPAVATAYKLAVGTCDVQSLPDMTCARGYAGILNCGLHAYLFGGYRPNLSSCETFDGFTEGWRPLGNMSQARACFNPVRHRTNVYLFESYISRKDLEVFSLVTEEFTLPGVCLPDFPAYSLSFMAEEKIVIVAGSEKAAISLLAPEIRVKRSTVKTVSSSLPCVSPAEAVNNIVYYVSYKGGNLYSFNRNLNTWKKEAMKVVTP